MADGALERTGERLSRLFILSSYPANVPSKAQLPELVDGLTEFLSLQDGKEVLDVNLGSGNFTKYLQNAVDWTDGNAESKAKADSGVASSITNQAEETGENGLSEHSVSDNPTLETSRRISAGKTNAIKPENSKPAAESKSTPKETEQTASTFSEAEDQLRTDGDAKGAPVHLSRAEFDQKAKGLAQNEGLGPFEQNPSVLSLCEDEDTGFLAYVMPDRLPVPPQSRRTLAELYFTVQAQPTTRMLPSSHKTLTTDKYKLTLLEGKLAVTYNRIEELKRSDKWSLRQRVKFKPPRRVKVHHDHVLDEMRWLQSCFSQGRKHKIALCWELSQMILQFFEDGGTLNDRHGSFASGTGLEERGNAGEAQTVDAEDTESEKVETGQFQTESETEGVESDGNGNQGSDNMVSSEANAAPASVDEGEAEDVTMGITGSDDCDSSSPKQVTKPLRSFVPVVGPHDTISNVLPNMISQDELDEMSRKVYDQLTDLPALNSTSHYISEFDNLSITPLTKFLAAPEISRGWRRMVLEKPSELPDGLRGDTEDERNMVRCGRVFQKHHHSDYDVRAPQPPDVRYMSHRLVSIWLPQDDQKLAKLAKELVYNWDLVSSYLSSTGTRGYTSNAERRTPWQCFERWLQLTPSFDPKDLKGQYAEQVRIWLDTSARAQSATKRRLAPLGVGADNLQRGHKRLRWSSMFDGMRKAKRKRENMPRGNPVRRQAAIDSSHSSGHSRAVPSAAELSKIKFDRDRAVAEAYAQQQKASQSDVSFSRYGRNASNNSGASAPPQGVAHGGSQGGQSASGPLGQPHVSNSGAKINQPHAGGSIAGLPLPSSVAAMAAARYSQEQVQKLAMEKQRQALQNQPQLQPPLHKPGQQAGAPSSGQAPAMFNNRAGFAPGAPTVPNVPSAARPSPIPTPNSSSGVPPGMRTKLPGQLPVSREQLAHLMSQIAAQNPNLTKEQVQLMASRQVQKFIQHKRAQAAQAAAKEAHLQAQASHASSPASQSGGSYDDA